MVILAIIMSILLLKVDITAEDIKRPDTGNSLTVGVDSNLPPFQFEEEGRLVGLNIDILNSIAAENDLKVIYVPINKENSIEKLLSGEIDMVLGVRYDAALDGKVEYTENIVQSVVCMLVRSEIYEDIKTNLNISSYIASVENNSVELNFLNNLRRVNYNVAFNQNDAFQLLMLDRADFLLGVKDTAEYYLNKYGRSKEYRIIDSYMTPVEYLIAVRPDNTKLLNNINSGLSRLKLSGEYEKLYNKWVENSEANMARRIERLIAYFAIGAIIVVTVLLIIMFWNMNLKKQVELKTQELQKSNLELEAQIIETRNNIELKNLICESSPRGIAIFDLNGDISILNNSALQMAGLEAHPKDRTIYDIEPMNLMLKDSVSMVLEDKTSYTCDEFRYKKGDKEYIYRYVVYPLNDCNQKIRGIIITIEDITKERRIRDQVLERSKNRALTQIIAGISHEIRNPLTTIKNFVELIPTKIDNMKFKEEIAVVVPEEINRVNNLIESLIDYAKPKGQVKAPASVADIIDSCISLFKPAFEQNSIEIEWGCEQGLYIYCDKSQVKQALINFILNSIDAVIEKKAIIRDTAYTGRISAYAYRKGNEEIIKIRDNGIGMDSQELEKAYDMFYTTKERGTGLGLPISLQMLDINDCKTYIDSRKGEYTEIILTFYSIN